MDCGLSISIKNERASVSEKSGVLGKNLGERISGKGDPQRQ
jgi:hypothetical protein